VIDPRQVEIGALKVLVAALLKHGFISRPRASETLMADVMEIAETMILPDVPPEHRAAVRQAIEDMAGQTIAFAVKASKAHSR
jgi:hypothetical protein